MRTYTSLSGLPPGEFKRLTGVSRPTFNTMVEIVAPIIAARQHTGGPRFTWGVEDMILMTLTYWREYRTYFHIGLDYNLSESQCFRTIKLVENTLIKDERFHLKGKTSFSRRGTPGNTRSSTLQKAPLSDLKKGAQKQANIPLFGQKEATHP